MNVSSESSKRRIVIVGPVHPLGGGVAQHVARLSNELAGSCQAHICIESWESQYPTFLHHFQVTVQEDSPEVPLSVSTERKLRWYSPFSWALAGLRRRDSSAVLFNIVTPFHAVPFAVLGFFLGQTATKVGIIHNALPHERSPFDRILLRLLARVCDAFVVHDVESEELLNKLLGRRKTVVSVRLPDPWQSFTFEAQSLRAFRRPAASPPISALFFGNVRPYKGLDVLLDALRSIPEVVLTVAGNFWEQEAAIARKVEEHGLTDRVILKSGYVDKGEIPNLFSQADVVVLPYVSGTASVIPQIAFSYGKPVIVTNVGSVASGVEDGVNGLVVSANNSQELAHGLSGFAQSFDLREKLTMGARESRLDDGWGRYVGALEKLLDKVMT